MSRSGKAGLDLDVHQSHQESVISISLTPEMKASNQVVLGLVYRVFEVVFRGRGDSEERQSRRWFEANDRRKRMLESPLFPLRESGERPTLEEFASMVLSENPQRNLDIGSGSGSSAMRMYSHIDRAEYVIAVEKDLRCLWQIEHRAQYIANRKGIGIDDLPLEAVGADARRLPFNDESFDYAATYHSLGEICGLSEVLLEARRVLEPGGRFQVSMSNKELANYIPPDRVEPLLEDLASRGFPLSSEQREYISTYLPTLRREQFLTFLEEADLFINLKHLKKQAIQHGFRVLATHLHLRQHANPRHDFILLLERP